MKRKKSAYVVLVFATALMFCIFGYVSVETKNTPINFYFPKQRITSAPIKHFEIPKEALLKSSAYYGILHNQTYGRPLLDFGLDSFSRIQPFNWLKYFPEFSASLHRYQAKNTLRNIATHTSSMTSLVDMDAERIYQIGDVFKARIYARDSLNGSKTIGGDYFRARILLQPPRDSFPDGIPCYIEDHINGTYTVTAPVLFSGYFELEVTLVVPLEGVERLITWTKMENHRGLAYRTTLESGEVVQCNYNLPYYRRLNKSKLCDYSNPRNREPWFCTMPPSSVCSPIIYSKFMGIGGMPFPVTRRAKTEYDLVSSRFTGKYSFVVSGENGSNGLPSELGAFGYFYKSRWKTLAGSTPKNDVASYLPDLTDKVIYMFGDSTLRQFFELAIEKFSMDAAGPDSSIFRQQPKVARSRSSNLTVYYRAHGPPLRNRGPPSSKPYISDSIDGIQAGGENVTVVFNLGLHFLEYDPSFFVHRLLGIKASILNHLRRYPQTRFIVKGMNVVVYEYEWLIRRLEVITRKIFKDVDDVIFLDLWNLTTVWPLKKFYHPVGKILFQEARLLFEAIARNT